MFRIGTIGKLSLNFLVYCDLQIENDAVHTLIGCPALEEGGITARRQVVAHG